MFDENHHGRFVGLIDARGQDFVSPRNIDSALWQVEGCPVGKFAETKTATASMAKRCTVSRDGDTLTLTWEDAGACVEKAVATFTAKPGAPEIRCRLAVTPRPGWALIETQFPRFALNERLGTTATDDAIVMGTGHDGLVRYPMNPRREYWKSRHVGHSPGNLVAQFGSFFDDRGGLYTMAEDADGNEKELLMDRWWRRDRPDGTYRLDFSKDFWARAAKHAVCRPDGQVRLDNLAWLGGGGSASMCPGDPWSVDWWNKDIACELVKRGADLVQADQDVGARVPTCWSTAHGHKPGPGRWALHAQRHQFETMLEEMRKINPNALFSFKEMHEYFNDIYAFCDYRSCRWPGPEWAMPALASPRSRSRSRRARRTPASPGS